jgi:hypothetical protein
MNTKTNHGPGQGAVQGTATIIQFPVGGRAAVAQHAAIAQHATVDRTQQDLPNVMYGSSWYHDAAIAQAVVPTKGRD